MEIKQEFFFSKLFLAAAIYNVVCGIGLVFFPNLFFQFLELKEMNHPFVMQGVGMIVGVYGYGYWVVSRDVIRFPQLVILGLMGKTFGPIGWVYHVIIGDLPAESMVAILFNDLMWLPFFTWYLVWMNKKGIALN